MTNLQKYPAPSFSPLNVPTSPSWQMTHLCKVKWVELELFSLLECHNLNVHGVRWEVASVNGIEEVSIGIIWVCASKLSSLVGWEALDTLVCLQNKINPCNNWNSIYIQLSPKLFIPCDRCKKFNSFQLGHSFIPVLSNSRKKYAKVCEQLKITYEHQIPWFQVLGRT